MKRLIILFIVTSQIALGQKIDYNKIILPGNAQNVDLGERLVQIAWENNPENKVLLRKKDVAKENVRIARWTFLDNATFQYNANEYTINKNQGDDNDPNNESVTNLFYPQYNFGIRASLGDFVRIPLITKRAKHELIIADETLNTKKLELRSKVLVAYQNYIMNKELVKIQSDVTEDANAAFSLAEKKFKDGDLSFEEYNEAQREYNAERVRRITAENAYQLSKIRLEEIVGVRMEDVE